MRRSRLGPIIGILAASSLFVSSTGAVAATSASAIPQVNPWAALTAMSGGAPAAVFCGAAAAAAAAQAATGGCVLPQVDQPVTAAGPPPPTPVPVPPVEPATAGFGIDPLILGLGALAAGALVYFLVIKKHHDHDESPA
jgi:hypothetical protein